MSRLFETHKMTVQHIKTTTVDRQHSSELAELITGVPCRVTGTDNGSIKLFILAKHYNTIPGGLHKNFRIVLEGDFVQSYTITREPIWAGGTYHHVECDLEESI